ncbi:MAG: ATP-binding protein [Chitinophagales bacterium]
MIRRCLVFLLFHFIINSSSAQRYIDSLRNELNRAKEDSNKALILCLIAGYHEYQDPDSNEYFVRQAIELSEKVHYAPGKLFAHITQFFTANLRSDYVTALALAQRNLQEAESMPYDRLYYMANARAQLGLVKNEMGDTIKAKAEVVEGIRLQFASGRFDGDSWSVYANIGRLYLRKNEDSCLHYLQKAYETSKKGTTRAVYSSLAAAGLAQAYQVYNRLPEARMYFQEALVQAKYYGNIYIEARIYMNLMSYFRQIKNYDSAIYFGSKSMQICNARRFGDYASTAGDLLARTYDERHQADSALKYFKISRTARDSIFSNANLAEFQLLISENEQKQREAQVAKEKFQNQVELYASLSALLFLLILSAVLYRNNRQKQKSFAIIKRQKQETDLQRAKVEQAYLELKTTQSQLIQSEKMASLGELTAGIAHEIQNPLNFVNNFAEVNDELIEEMGQAMDKGNYPEAMNISANIRQNLEKIHHHGKRADAIVKNMLMHSRTGTGQKELTDLNALADEYLRLSYHGFRAKEKSFKAELKSDLDPGLGKISLVQQEIGKVLFNLFNNSFYSMNKKMRDSASNGYQPELLLRTQRLDSHIEITIRDNGIGISEKNLEKIFQPFFSTRPTGEGTGLGLSLSYDIITKEHGGSIRVNSKEGEFAEFVLELPC